MINTRSKQVQWKSDVTNPDSVSCRTNALGPPENVSVVQQVSDQWVHISKIEQQQQRKAFVDLPHVVGKKYIYIYISTRKRAIRLQTLARTCFVLCILCGV